MRDFARGACLSVGVLGLAASALPGRWLDVTGVVALVLYVALRGRPR